VPFIDSSIETYNNSRHYSSHLNTHGPYAMLAEVKMIEETVSLETNEEIGNNIWLMEFRSPSLASRAQPGQFLMVHVSKRTKDPLLRRPFSIHGIQDRDRAMLLYNKVGAGTALLSTLKKHDSISIIGPLGNGFTLPGPRESTLLLAGGMGLAPLFFLVQALQRAQRNVGKVFVGFSTSEQVVRFEQLKELGVDLSLTTEDGSLGSKGVVTDLLEGYLGSEVQEKPVIYGCGPLSMLKKVAHRAAALNLKCYVSLEGYMACGLGICMGCAVKSAPGEKKPYYYVCQDGPVFPSRAIDWEVL
jgi:dihydroorotate dehydrogenase electron transfer subunit